MKKTMSLALKAFIREGFPKQEMSASFVPKAITKLVNFDVGKNYGHWSTLPIPRMTLLTWWNRQWEIRISTFPYMDWGLFTLQNLETEE